MSVKYTPLAEEILGLVGGPDNVTKVYHCVTRLRFSLKDDSKVDAKKIADLDDVAQTLTSGGVFQVVIGTHVKDVFEEVEKLITAAGVNLSDAVSAPEQKMNPVMKVIDFISSTFTPVIPAIAGAAWSRRFCLFSSSSIGFRRKTRHTRSLPSLQMLASISSRSSWHSRQQGSSAQTHISPQLSHR